MIMPGMSAVSISAAPTTMTPTVAAVTANSLVSVVSSAVAAGAGGIYRFSVTVDGCGFLFGLGHQKNLI
jgi:hypothetical protein